MRSTVRSVMFNICVDQTQEDVTIANPSGEMTIDGETLVNLVNKAVTAIMSRLQSKSIDLQE